MGLAAILARRLGLSFLQRGSLELFSLPSARRLVDACLQEQAAVLGIEGFRLQASQTVPDMDAIVDLSALAELPWSERLVRSVADTKAYLDAVSDPELLFDLSLVQEEEKVL